MGSPEELAYAGGLFEGEGSFTLSCDNRFPHRPYRTCCASISMCDREPLERFGAAVGMGRFYGPYQVKTRPNHRVAARQGQSHSAIGAARTVPDGQAGR